MADGELVAKRWQFARRVPEFPEGGIRRLSPHLSLLLLEQCAFLGVHGVRTLRNRVDRG